MAATTKSKYVRITVNEHVNLDNLQEALKRVVGMTGCTTCGLVGIDFHMVGGDPEASKEFQGIQGIVAARMSGGE